MALTLTDLSVLIRLMKTEMKSLDSVANDSFVDSRTSDDCGGRLVSARETAAHLKEAYESQWTPASNLPSYDELVNEQSLGALIT